MKYFTRARFDALQCDEGARLEAAQADWDEAVDAYQQHLAEVQPSLPASAHVLSGVTLHDGRVVATRRDDDAFVLEVDSTHNPWGPKGHLRLRYTGVAACEIQGDILGDGWLYEEIHLHEAGFEHRILFDGSELRVAAAHVEIGDVVDG